MFSKDNFLAVSNCYCADRLCVYRLVKAYDNMDLFKKCDKFKKDINCNVSSLISHHKKNIGMYKFKYYL